MLSKPAAIRGSRFWLSIVMAASVATFSIGLATGASLPRAADRGRAPDAAVGGAGDVSRAVVPGAAATTALDTSKLYLTIQHGVIVPGAAATSSLDTAEPYLTIQHGVIVPGVGASSNRAAPCYLRCGWRPAPFAARRPRSFNRVAARARSLGR